MSRAYEKAIMNDEGNEDDRNGEISWGIVHMKGFGNSKYLRQHG